MIAMSAMRQHVQQNAVIAKQTCDENRRDTLLDPYFRSNTRVSSIEVKSKHFDRKFEECQLMRNLCAAVANRAAPISVFRRTVEVPSVGAATAIAMEGSTSGIQQRAPLHPANTVVLVNAYTENTFVVRPEKKDVVLRNERATVTTLDVLRRGMYFYKKIDRPDSCGESSNDEYLEAFCCKLPQKKHYYFYKQVKIVEPSEDETTTGHRRRTSRSWTRNENEERNRFALIKRYVECFATLAEFSYEFNVLTLETNSGLPNVLVVDKIWNYNKDKRLFIPTYKLLVGDVYTDYVLASLKALFGCDTIGFISTLHTSLFANHTVLQQSPITPPTLFDAREAAAKPSIETSPPAMSSRPLKKRKIIASTSDKSQKSVTFADENQVTLCKPDAATTAGGGVALHNPTLIVFKQNYVKRDSHLVCPICIEIHLSNNVVYC